MLPPLIYMLRIEVPKCTLSSSVVQNWFLMR
uniref:Uncharacterized protein n=1 Tax=Rhizophora mucronata TaxID=61149 RepID=A0A2P2IZZ3_RHIMU